MLQNHPTPESRTLPQHITDEHNGLSYTLHGDYYFPDLSFRSSSPSADGAGCTSGTWNRTIRVIFKGFCSRENWMLICTLSMSRPASVSMFS